MDPIEQKVGAKKISVEPYIQESAVIFTVCEVSTEALVDAISSVLAVKRDDIVFEDTGEQLNISATEREIPSDKIILSWTPAHCEGELKIYHRLSIWYPKSLVPMEKVVSDEAGLLDPLELSKHLGLSFLVSESNSASPDTYRLIGPSKYPGLYWSAEHSSGDDYLTRVEIPGFDDLIPQANSTEKLMPLVERCVSGDEISNGPYALNYLRVNAFNVAINSIVRDPEGLQRIAKLFHEAALSDRKRADNFGAWDCSPYYHQLTHLAEERAAFLAARLPPK